MASVKNIRVATEEDIKSVKSSLSDLKDRLAILENEARASQKRIQQDMKRLVEMVQANQKGRW